MRTNARIRVLPRNEGRSLGRASFVASCMIAGLFPVGCAGLKPSAFPIAPLRIDKAPQRGIIRSYDVSRDGKVDLVQRLDADGQIVGLRFPDKSGAVDEIPYPPADRSAARLLIIFDSIPYESVAAAWRQGRFRMFAPPSRVVSPFPVMTDPSIAAFVGALPIPGVESAFVEDGRLVAATSSYLQRRNMSWLAWMDYSLDTIAHVFAYTEPDPWLDLELARIEQHFDEALAAGHPDFSAYVLSTSAIGSRAGRNGHQHALIRIDRFCNALLYKLRGRLQITLLSDHGHTLAASTRLDLSNELRLAGYRVGDRLDADTDVILPEWGLVSTVSIYTRLPATVACDALGFEGVELSAYRDGETVVVWGAEGRAHIESDGGRLRYMVETGDPLHLAQVMGELRARGSMDESGFMTEDDWFAATSQHEYVDPVFRLWSAFHGQFVNTPDVMLSLRDGVHTGSDDLDHSLPMAATHGNLRKNSSYAFAMTTAGPLPPLLRMRDLAAALRAIGAPAPRQSPARESVGASATGDRTTAAAAADGRMIAPSTIPARNHDAKMSTP